MTINGLIGRKVGMTQVFDKGGISISVTIIEITPNRVTQIRNIEKDGYCAVQLVAGSKDVNLINKPKLGHLRKAGVNSGKCLREFFISNTDKFSIGDVITISVFEGVRKVDITGVSKGKGFSGTVKRWNFHMQDASHGNSLSHRAPGSIGQNQTPGRVFKGKKMAGQLGGCQVTVQNLEVINIDIKDSFLLVRGSVPGVIGGNLFVRMSIKK